VPRRFRQRWFAIGATLAGLWAAFCGAVGAVALSQVASSSNAGGQIVGGIIALLAGAFPATLLWRSARARKNEPPAFDPKRLPVPERRTYLRLTKAHDDAQQLVEAGILDLEALSGLGKRIAELGLLLEAETRNRRLGGSSSPKVEGEVDELADLLVELAGAAVDRQMAATADEKDDLHDLKDRLQAEADAHREIGQIEA
jgi:hypothetical protein